MRRGFFSAIVAVGVLAVLELGSFLFFRAFGDRFVFANPEGYVVAKDRIKALQPGFDAELGWNYHFDTPHGERPQREVYEETLMATFGDSHVFGDEVEAADTWQVSLSERLQANVLNFGVSGYGTDQALLKMRRLLPEVGAPIVCLHVGPENINRIVNRYRPFYFPQTGLAYPKPRFVLDADGQLRLLENPLHDGSEMVRLADPDFIHQLGTEDDWYARRDLPRLGSPYLRLVFDPRIWRQALIHSRRRTDTNAVPQANLWRRSPDARRLYFAIMDAFAQEVAAAGSHAVFVLLPGTAVNEALRSGSGIPGYRRILDHCAQRRYDCFDGIAWVERDAADGPLDPYFQPGGHVSPRGNAVTAEGLAEFLQERGLTTTRLETPPDLVTTR